VPPGGVVEGQVFLIPLPDDFAVGEPRIQTPTGQWKDGTFDIFKAGVCHPSLWCALCCTQGEMFLPILLTLRWGGGGAEGRKEPTIEIMIGSLLSVRAAPVP
jgi:hypothetical protein